MSPAPLFDVERVICRLSDIDDPGARGFTMGRGDWPLRGFVVRVGTEAHAYVNRCPHARHPLNLGPNRFLTPGGELILCSSHGALFDRHTGYCIAGPCSGQSLVRVPLRIEAGIVMLADDVDVEALAERD
jgi:nitrite reductase/ring-hydroxylating ferredoxin subunit